MLDDAGGYSQSPACKFNSELRCWTIFVATWYESVYVYVYAYGYGYDMICYMWLLSGWTCHETRVLPSVFRLGNGDSMGLPRFAKSSQRVTCFRSRLPSAWCSHVGLKTIDPFEILWRDRHFVIMTSFGGKGPLNLPLPRKPNVCEFDDKPDLPDAPDMLRVPSSVSYGRHEDVGDVWLGRQLDVDEGMKAIRRSFYSWTEAKDSQPNRLTHDSFASYLDSFMMEVRQNPRRFRQVMKRRRQDNGFDEEPSGLDWFWKLFDFSQWGHFLTGSTLKRLRSGYGSTFLTATNNMWLWYQEQHLIYLKDTLFFGRANWYLNFVSSVETSSPDLSPDHVSNFQPWSQCWAMIILNIFFQTSFCSQLPA